MSIHNLLWKVFNREENGYFLVYTFLLRLLWQALVNHNCLGFKRFALSVHFCNITWNFSWNVSAYIIGVFIARGKEDALVTLNMVPGETVYGEKKIVVEVSIKKKPDTSIGHTEVRYILDEWFTENEACQFLH